MSVATIRLLLIVIAFVNPSTSWIATAAAAAAANQNAPDEPAQLLAPSAARSSYDNRHPDDLNDFLINGREPRWTREPVRVDYGGRHPFETDTQHENMQNARQVQSIPASVFTDLRYKPVRVQFDTHLLDALYDEYPSHVSYVRDVLLQQLGTFWAEALSVIPAEKIEVPLLGRCAAEVKQLTGFDIDEFLQYDANDNNNTVSNIGDEGNVEMSSDGNSLVYNNKDLVVIVLPMERTVICPEGVTPDSQSATLAFATNCQHDQIDRPTVGYTGICFGPLDLAADNSTKVYQRQLLTLSHEFTHILGMNSYDFPFFYNHATGKPRTPRNQWNQPPIDQILCVNGTRSTMLIASEDTLKPVTTANGYLAYEVTTETVRNVVRNQFDCQTLEGGRLENQPTSSTDCYGSHWDQRLFNNDYMVGIYTGSSQYVTALTLALLEDSGWYRTNYEIAQNSPYGLGAGCEFVEEQCLQNGTVPMWASETFCDSATSIGCTPDKQVLAYCDISQWDGNLPPGYQYFEDPSMGGALQQRDFCPGYTITFRFELGDEIPVLDCTDPDLDGSWVQMKDDVFGKDSRCIAHASGTRPSCLKIICGEDGEDKGKVVMVTASGERIRCSYDGEVVQLNSGANAICPSFDMTCPELICPANCAGRGICDYSVPIAECKCFDQSDTSPLCAGSPLSSAPTISSESTQGASPTSAPVVPPKTVISPPIFNLPSGSLAPIASLSASPSKASTTGSPVVALDIGSPTAVPITKPTIAEDTQIPQPTGPLSGVSLQPGVANGSPVTALVSDSPTAMPMVKLWAPESVAGPKTESSRGYAPHSVRAAKMFALVACGLWLFA